MKKKMIIAVLISLTMALSGILSVAAAQVETSVANDSIELNPSEEAKNYPEIQSISCINGGFKIAWNKFEGAEKYRLFYRNGTAWKSIGTTTQTTLNHTGLKNNTEYTYTVRALDKNGNYVSMFNSPGWSSTFLSVPSLSSVESTTTGLKITWQKVEGAANYRVYVMSGSKWKKIGETTSNAFTHTSVTSGKSYTYTVRSISADSTSYTSYYDTKGISKTFVAVPQITKIENIANGSKITWGKVAGASKYRLFYRNGTAWKSIGTTTETTLKHTGLKNNTTYTYTVRALDKNGNYVSMFRSPGWSNTFLSVPSLSSVESTTTGLKITWQKVEGAVNYRVYVKSGSNWQKIGETTSNTFTHTSVTSGKSYTYTVRSISADGTCATSYYDTKGISKTFVAAPQITKIENIANGSKITWGKVAGASEYRVFYRNGTAWKSIGTTAATTLNHTGLKNNTEYIYTVRALDKNGNYVSAFQSPGWSNLFIAPPEYTSIIQSENGMLLKWNAVNTVASYRIYRKNYGASWTKIADVAGTSYTDTNPPQNTLYSYTLRCFNSSGSVMSSYLNDTQYYYNGALANGKITVNGTGLYFIDGHFRQGYVTINGDTYYYNASGVLQKNGIVGTRAEGYCYADKNGKIDYSFTGIAQNASGYWYIKKGKLDFTYRNAVTYNGSDWNVIDGKATKVTTEEQRTLFRAFKLLSKITDSSMTNSQKLKKCFDYVKGAYIEKNPRIPHYKGMDWPVIYANDMFVRGTGNCFSYAACFAYLAKAIGYENVYCCHSGGHGWAEIDGLVYDPEWSIHHSKYTYYALSYNTKTDVDYKGAIASGYAWMHVKI